MPTVTAATAAVTTAAAVVVEVGIIRRLKWFNRVVQRARPCKNSRQQRVCMGI